MFKSVTKSKFLAFFAVIALFSAVIFAGGCDGSSSSSPSKTISAGVLSGEMDEIFEKELKEEGVVFETLSLDSSPTKLIVVGEGAAIDETQLEYLGNALASGSVVAFEEASKEQLAQFGEMLGTPLDVYGADDGIYFTAVSTHGGHTHIYLIGKDYETKFDTEQTYNEIDDTKDPEDDEPPHALTEEHKHELSAEEKKQLVLDYHAGELVDWINEGIEEATDFADKGGAEAVKAVTGKSSDDEAELKKYFNATTVYQKLFNRNGNMSDNINSNAFNTVQVLWAPVEHHVAIYAIHSFEQDKDYYYVKYTSRTDPSTAKIRSYTSLSPCRNMRKKFDGWLTGWWDWPIDGTEKLFYGNNPKDINFFWYFGSYVYHGYPEQNYYNLSLPKDDIGIYRAWNKYASTWWTNYIKEFSTTAVPTNELVNAGLIMHKHKPDESTKEKREITETSSWSISGNVGVQPKWEKVQKSPADTTGVIGISGGFSKTHQEKRDVLDCYLTASMQTVGDTYVAPSIRYEFYDFTDPDRKLTRSRCWRDGKLTDASAVSRSAFKSVSDWQWSFDSKKLRALTPEQRSFTVRSAYTTAGTRCSAGGSGNHVGFTWTSDVKAMLPIPPRLVAQNPKADGLKGSNTQDYTTISTDSKEKTDGVAVQIFSNEDWTVTSNQPWCRPQVKGPQPKDLKLLNLTVDANDSTTQRTAKVTVRAGTNYSTVEVVQSAGKAR